jgi:hypothetical protein
VFRFQLNDETFEIVMTKHGHFRVLESKNVTFEEIGQTITAIGLEEIDLHFRDALEKFPLNKRQHIEWERQVDYCIALYDTMHEMVFVLGLHPHLKRITIVTIIPRIENVFADVFAAYRIDNEKTESLDINATFSKKIEIKKIKVV